MSVLAMPTPTVAVSSMSAVLTGVWGDMDEARKGDHGGVTGITTGVHLIDRETSGWQPGDLDVIAARTNVGKTAAALHMARHAALAGRPVLFVPLEMTARACALRVIAAHGCLDERALRTGQGTIADYTAAARVIAQLGDLPLMWAEPRRLALEGLRDTIAHQQEEAGGCEVVFVDQLGNLKPPNSKDGRVWQVAAITGGLKEIARELAVAIVACHQINREAEHAQNKRPELWHLKDSGSVEQDADVVLLMHREWVPGQNQQSGPIEVTVAKNRRGRRVTTSLMYHGHQTRFEDAAPTSGWAPE